MTEHNYLLEIYDAEEFNGPNPLTATGMGIINGPENTQYFIVETHKKIQPNGQQINHLALRAHYGEDSIDKVTGSVTTVGIALMKPGQEINTDKTYGFDDFIFWKVGKLHPQD